MTQVCNASACLGEGAVLGSMLFGSQGLWEPRGLGWVRSEDPAGC